MFFYVNLLLYVNFKKIEYNLKCFFPYQDELYIKAMIINIITHLSTSKSWVEVEFNLKKASDWSEN